MKLLCTHGTYRTCSANKGKDSCVWSGYLTSFVCCLSETTNCAKASFSLLLIILGSISNYRIPELILIFSQDNVGGGGGNLTPGNNNGNPGDNGVNGDTLDNMKQSPGTAPGTPRDSGGGSEPLPDFNLPNFPAPGNSVSDRARLSISQAKSEKNPG